MTSWEHGRLLEHGLSLVGLKVTFVEVLKGRHRTFFRLWTDKAGADHLEGLQLPGFYRTEYPSMFDKPSRYLVSWLRQRRSA